ncbi:MAG: GNAT family protein [Pseudomonadota bacterium]
MLEFAALSTPRLDLRLPANRDIGQLVELAGDFRIFDTTENIPHPYDAADAEAFILRAEAAWQSRRALHVVAIEKSERFLCGYAMLRFDAGLNSAELGYWIGAPYWHQGFATEAADALVTYAFGTLALQRLSACYLTRNAESGRVLEKLGFEQEGLQRQHSFKYGYGEDLVLTGLLRSEWLARPNH